VTGRTQILALAMHLPRSRSLRPVFALFVGLLLALRVVLALPVAEAQPAPTRVVRAGRAVIQGSIPQGAVARILARHLREVSACADTHGTHDLVLRLVVAPTGAVQTATAEGDRAFGDCVVQAASTWVFPATDAGVTTIEVPLTFTER